MVGAALHLGLFEQPEMVGAALHLGLFEQPEQEQLFRNPFDGWEVAGGFPQRSAPPRRPLRLGVKALHGRMEFLTYEIEDGLPDVFFAERSA